MSTKYKTNKRKLSSLVKQQVPEFVLTDHPKFAEFLSSYFLFMESAELNLETFTTIDNILLETEGTTDNYVLLDRTDAFNLDAGGQIVSEQNSAAGSFAKDEVITGSTSGATKNFRWILPFGWPKKYPCQRSGLLCAWRTVLAYCFGHHDGYDGQGCRMRASCHLCPTLQRQARTSHRGCPAFCGSR